MPRNSQICIFLLKLLAIVGNFFAIELKMILKITDELKKTYVVAQFVCKSRMDHPHSP